MSYLAVLVILYVNQYPAPSVLTLNLQVNTIVSQLAMIGILRSNPKNYIFRSNRLNESYIMRSASGTLGCIIQHGTFWNWFCWYSYLYFPYDHHYQKLSLWSIVVKRNSCLIILSFYMIICYLVPSQVILWFPLLHNSYNYNFITFCLLFYWLNNIIS